MARARRQHGERPVVPFSRPTHLLRNIRRWLGLPSRLPLSGGCSPPPPPPCLNRDAADPVLREFVRSGCRLGIGEQDAHEFFVGLVEKLDRWSTTRAVRSAATEPGLQDLLSPRPDRDRRIWAGAQPQRPPAVSIPSALLLSTSGLKDGLLGGEAPTSSLPDTPPTPRPPPPSDVTGGPLPPSMGDATPGRNPPPRAPAASPKPSPAPAWVTELVRGIVPDGSLRPWAASGTDTISGVFTGYTGSSVICTKCKQPTPLRLSPFKCLTLELPPGLRTTSVGQCLGMMASPEPIDGYRCERCNEQTPCFKQTVIARRPAALCLWVGLLPSRSPVREGERGFPLAPPCPPPCPPPSPATCGVLTRLRCLRGLCRLLPGACASAGTSTGSNRSG